MSVAVSARRRRARPGRAARPARRRAEAAALRPLGLGGVLLGAGRARPAAGVVAELRRGDGDVVLLADRRRWPARDGEVKAALARCRRRACVEVRRVGDADADATLDATRAARRRDGRGRRDRQRRLGHGRRHRQGRQRRSSAGVPHVVVQTAASVNGFADDQSVLLRRRRQAHDRRRAGPSGW